ncbi:MAG: CoA transferase, partial [Chloroflexota bacterium]|nr:CoA transferase [Chloroflexota bacterium]
QAQRCGALRQAQDGALSDLRVVECAQMVSGPFCGKLLADQGAQVIKVEPPQGDEARAEGPFPGDVPHPERSGLFFYLNTNKLGITLDLRSTRGKRILRQLVSQADILVENYPPKEAKTLGLRYQSLRRINPRLIMVSITSFGQTGPYRDYKATDLVSFHMGGVGYATPGEVDDLKAQPPLKAGGRQADFLAGLAAAAATGVALAARWATGQGRWIDLSEQEVVASMMVNDISRLSYEGQVVGRLRNTVPQIVPCKDGYVAVEAYLRPHMWQRWVEVMGNPEWAKEEIFRTPESRVRYWDGVEAAVCQWTMQHTKEDIYRAAQANRVPCFPINNIDEVLQSKHLAARDLFMELEHPEMGKVIMPRGFGKFSCTPWQVTQPAPPPGAAQRAGPRPNARIL